jgi:Trk K+ transport system NAD-binding subunit
MIARELNKDIDIYARCDKPAFVSKLKKAGAKIVVVPEIVAADKIIDAIK